MRSSPLTMHCTAAQHSLLCIANHVVDMIHLCVFVAWQDIKTALGLPSGIKLGQYNALAAFTANPSGPGRKVGLS